MTTRWQTWGVAALVLVGCETSGPSGTMCTLIGCIDGLSVDFVRGAWPDGSYSVRVRQDGKAPTFCTAKLPFEPSGSSGKCDAIGVALGSSGQMLPANQQALTGLRISGTPAHVEIEVSRNGTVELSTAVTPSYVTTNPNGPDCGPTCTQASVKVTIP